MKRTVIAAATAVGLTLSTPVAAFEVLSGYFGRVISGMDYGAFGSQSSDGVNLAGLKFAVSADFDTAAPNIGHVVDPASEQLYFEGFGGLTLSIESLPETRTLNSVFSVEADYGSGGNWFRYVAQDSRNSNVSVSIFDALAGPRIADLQKNYTLPPGYNYAYFEDYSLSRTRPSFAILGISLVTYNILGSVPEPASWSLMIAGFGLIGTTARRRRRAEVVLA